LCQSIFAILQQCAHLSLVEEPLDSAATLLGLNIGMDFVEGARGGYQYQIRAFHKNITLQIRQRGVIHLEAAYRWYLI
jgi:hypothetical protein